MNIFHKNTIHHLHLVFFIYNEKFHFYAGTKILISNSKIVKINQFLEGGSCLSALTTLSRSRVFEWQTVTVALFHLSSSAIGVPTILLRPRTTAVLPSILTPVLQNCDMLDLFYTFQLTCGYFFINSRQPNGVHGRKPVFKSPTATLPWFSVFNPSTSLLVATESVIRVESIGLVESRGIWTMIPWTFTSSFIWFKILRS